MLMSVSPRLLPRDNKNDPEVVYYYLDTPSTNTNNPLANWQL